MCESPTSGLGKSLPSTERRLRVHLGLSSYTAKKGMAQDHPQTNLDYLSSEHNFLSHHLYWQKPSRVYTIYMGIKMTDTVPTYFFSNFANPHQYDSSNAV